MKTILFTNILFSLTTAFAAYGDIPPVPGEDAPLAIVALADGREILAKDGLTVYLFDQDVDANSTCYDACANAWPPVLAKEGESFGASMGITIRKDGSQQLTYDGFPIYFFVGDGASGQINGDGLGGVWHIIVE